MDSYIKRYLHGRTRTARFTMSEVAYSLSMRLHYAEVKEIL